MTEVQADSLGPSDRTTVAINDKDSVALGEAAARFGVNRSALRRRLKAGKIPGAWRATGPNGSEWRVPLAALEKLGYRLVESDRPVESEGSTESNRRGRASDHAKLGTITRYFIDVLKRERAKLLEAEEARIELATASEAGRAEAIRLRAELDEKIGALSAAERSRRAAALGREAAHIESLLVKSQLGVERARLEQAEQDKRRAALAAFQARAAERAARPTWLQMLRMRATWTLTGAAVTLGALVLVASILFDSLFGDGMTDEQPFPRPAIPGGPPEPGGGLLDASHASATSTLPVAAWKARAHSSASKDAPNVDRASGRSTSNGGVAGGDGRGPDDDVGDGGDNSGRRDDPRAGAADQPSAPQADQPSAPQGSKGTTGAGAVTQAPGDAVDSLANTAGSVGETAGSTANRAASTAGDLVDTAADTVGGAIGEPAGNTVASAGRVAKAAGATVEDATGAIEGTLEGAVEGLLVP